MGRKDINGYIEKIYAQTSSYLIKYITVKCRCMEDIQDILQNTYLGFIDTVQRHGYTNIFNPKHYLLRIAKREVAKFYGDKTKHDNVIIASTNDDNYVERDLDGFLEQDFCTEDGFTVEIWDRIQCMGTLTAKIFTLRFAYNETIEKISEQLEISPSNVKNLLYRGIKLLREEMHSGK